MADEISTTEDLLRLWHEDEEFRAASRRELLTNELIELPEKFAENARQVDSQLKGMGNRLDGVDTRLEGVETRLDGVETRLEGVETRLDGVETRLEGVETRLGSVEITVDSLRGDALEAKVPTHLCQLLSDTLGIRRVQVIWMSREVIAPLHRMDNFARDVESGADEGTITSEEEGRLNRTDMVARAIRERDGTRLWIVAEVSGLIGERDIRRARESATALRKLYSQETVPVVYGYRIADQQRRSAQAREGLEEVLIFLEPTDP